MANTGITIVAQCIEDEALVIFTVSFSSFLQNNNEEFLALPEDVLEKIGFLHSRGITVGPELLSPNEVLIVGSTEGPQAILKFRRGVSPNKIGDVQAAGRIFNFIMKIVRFACGAFFIFLMKDVY